jgi:hypothetical protein
VLALLVVVDLGCVIVDRYFVDGCQS